MTHTWYGGPSELELRLRRLFAQLACECKFQALPLHDRDRLATAIREELADHKARVRVPDVGDAALLRVPSDTAPDALDRIWQDVRRTA
jgi:hypothetical protein